MTKAKKIFTVSLIATSLALLLILQFFWLRKIYKDEHESFRKETSYLFRSTIFELSDSLMAKNIIPLDSSRTGKLVFLDSVIAKGHRKKEKGHFSTSDTDGSVQVFISSESQSKDSLPKFIRPLLSRIKKGGGGNRRFSIRLKMDSLKMEDVTTKYKLALRKADIHQNFEIQKQKQDSFPSFSQHEHNNEKYIYTPAGIYQLNFIKLNGYLLAKISPQILFSVFLTLITSAAFLLLYRNLRTQQRLMAQKNDFISNISHELKTPISTVSVAIEALQNFKGTSDPQVTSEYLNIAKNELTRLNMITDRILKTAIFENEQIDFAAENVRLDKLVEGILVSMKLIIEKQNAQVQLEKTGENFFLLGSRDHLSNVIYNLLDNALKYSTASPHVKITLIDLKDKIEIRFQDQGIGIEEVYRKKIFEKFFRVPTGDVHNIKGHGLGLSYVASVVKEHRGTIALISELGKGSTFILRLPKK